MPARPLNVVEIDPAKVLRAAGQRVTPVRLAVVRVLGAASAALDAAGVREAIRLDQRAPGVRKRAGGGEETAAERVDRVSIYRTLNMLVEVGIAHRIDAGDRVFRYSLTDHTGCDHAGGHHQHEHPHIVCDTCGSVECLTGAQVIIKHSPRAEPSRFSVRAQEVTLRGLCERCEQAGAKVLAKRRARTAD